MAPVNIWLFLISLTLLDLLILQVPIHGSVISTVRTLVLLSVELLY